MSERQARYDRRERILLLREMFQFTHHEMREKVRSDPSMKIVLAMNDLEFLKFMMNCARNQALKEVAVPPMMGPVEKRR